MISRRDAVKLGAAAMTAPIALSRIQSAMTRQDDPGVWNWKGNAGHTGEMPGPGLDFGGPLGERWRSSNLGDFWNNKLLSYSNGILISKGTSENGDSIYGTDASNGAQLWSRLLPDSEVNGSSTPSVFTRDTEKVANVDDRIICSLGYGFVWALDAKSGEDLWTYNFESQNVSPPTITNDTAYFARIGGVVALDFKASPKILWDTQIDDHNVMLIGVDNDLAWVASEKYVIALDVESGNEYWRTPKQELSDMYLSWIGITNGLGLYRSDRDLLAVVNNKGTVEWSTDDSEYYSGHKWIFHDLVSRLTDAYGDWEGAKIQALSIHDGTEQWECEVYDRWVTPDQPPPIICDGVAYSRIYDSLNDHYVLLAIDPVAITVMCVRDSTLRPVLVTDGMMFAYDRDTDELVAIGSVNPVLKEGGRARANSDITLRGAPNDDALDRRSIATDTTLIIIGDQEGEYIPVITEDEGQSGWLLTTDLEGLDGDTVFSQVDVSEFGLFTDYRE